MEAYVLRMCAAIAASIAARRGYPFAADNASCASAYMTTARLAMPARQPSGSSEADLPGRRPRHFAHLVVGGISDEDAAIRSDRHAHRAG
jgi:hypothetical protein